MNLRQTAKIHIYIYLSIGSTNTTENIYCRADTYCIKEIVFHWILSVCVNCCVCVYMQNIFEYLKICTILLHGNNH